MSRSKYDNDKKSDVIEKGTIHEVLQAKKDLYFSNLKSSFDDNGVLCTYYCDDDFQWFKYLNDCKHDSDLDCALLLIESKKRKMAKVRKKIADIILNNNAVFITLTFRDDVLNGTSPQTRRRYVARYLKSQGCEYVANIDFSPDVGREHYHAVICSRCDLNAWNYGFSSAEKIRAHSKDLYRLSKYITKLTNHALKIDATRLIYSRL